MPGSLCELRCPDCRVIHELSTGADHCYEHGEPWEYEQWVCPRCQSIISLQSDFCCNVRRTACQICGTELQRWSGRVWLDQDPEGFAGPEHIEGPCPRCETTITEANSTNWHGLWD